MKKQLTKEELRNAIEELSPDLEDNEKTKSSILRLDYNFKTEHLPHFETFKSIFKLQGEIYNPILKGCYYNVLSKIASSKIEKVSVGELNTDLRMHLTIPVSSGQGKKNIKTAVTQIFKRLGYVGNVPTSFHPEQFIGKVINRGKPMKPQWVKNEGYLSRDYIVIDEAYGLFMSKEQQIQETRKNFRIAKDPIGENLVEKKSVDNTFAEEETLSYYPKCVCIQFLQPKPLDSHIVEEGDLRRDLILYVKGLANRDKSEDYKKRLRNADNSDEALNSFCKYLENDVRNKLTNFQINFEEEAIDKLSELHSSLITKGFSHSERGSNFANMVDFTMQDFLVKLSSLIAIAYGQTIVTKEMVELAFMDLFEFFGMQLDYINDKVKGKLDYGDSWGGAKEKDRECLEWLYKQKAVDYDTKIELNKFKDVIAKIKDVGEEQATKDYQRFIKNKWVETKHEFQKYYVWLGFTPEYINSKLILHAGNDSNVSTAYNSVISDIKNIIGELPTLPTLLP